MRKVSLLVLVALLVVAASAYGQRPAPQPTPRTYQPRVQVTPPAPVQMIRPMAVQPMQTSAQRGQVQSEHLRCTETCNTFTSHYRFRYSQMTSHEGDATCWSTCWQRFGGTGTPPAAQMKTFWAQRRPLNMKNNLCSQACWRTFHGGSGTAQVANWMSSPRPIERCYGEAARNIALAPPGVAWTAPLTTALVLAPTAIASLPSMVAAVPNRVAALPNTMGTPGATIVPE